MTSRHIHFEPIGGAAGDMFVGAMLDAFPEAWPTVADAVNAATHGEAKATLEPWRDHALAGRRFDVVAAEAAHSHRRLGDIGAMLGQSGLPARIRDRALAIFGLLAKAEGQVHGIDPSQVTFHEVGALDSIGDIVAAAALIDHCDGARYSLGPLPLGSGRVQTAHGTLPVPAPAVVELLQGFVVHDDGIPGERVTPTAAAILRHLSPSAGSPPKGKLIGRGLGFGARRLPGISNIVRVLVVEPVADTNNADWQSEQVAALSFEIDDQSPEDLAIALDRLRALEGVLDVLQIPVTMKKGRLAIQVQVLARPDRRTAVIAACFDETTTLGLRFSLVDRAALPRRVIASPSEGGARVKLATRPGGRRTAKAEADDVSLDGDRQAREAARHRATEAALVGERDDD